MPVPIDETPLARYYEAEGRHRGRQEGRQEGRHEADVRWTAALLRQRFGDDRRIEALAPALADLPDDRRLDLITRTDLTLDELEARIDGR